MTKHSFYRTHKCFQLDFSGNSRTQQNMRDECNINIIMKKFEKTGIANHLNDHQGDYGDFTSFEGYHDAMNIVATANEMFSSIPAKIREQFKNDPSVFLQFSQDPKNLDRMVELGLATAKPIEPSTEAPKKKGASPPPTEETPSTEEPSSL